MKHEEKQSGVGASLFTIARRTIRLAAKAESARWLVQQVEWELAETRGKRLAERFRKAVLRHAYRLRAVAKPWVAPPKPKGVCPVCGAKSRLKGGWCSEWCKYRWNEQLRLAENPDRRHWKDLGNGGYMAIRHSGTM